VEILAAAADATALRVFFSFLLVLVLAAGFYIFRIDSCFSATKGPKATRMRRQISECGS
jgi:hypothetical protein